MSSMTRAIDQYLEATQPADVVKHNAAMRRVIDPAEGINPAAVAPHLTPLVLRWGPSDTGRWPVARSGKAVRLWACAETPPSSGNAIVTFTVLTEFAGVTTIGTLTIPNGQQIASRAITYVLPANAAIGATVTTANGASGVGTAVFIDTGGPS